MERVEKWSRHSNRHARLLELC